MKWIQINIRVDGIKLDSMIFNYFNFEFKLCSIWELLEK